MKKLLSKFVQVVTALSLCVAVIPGMSITVGAERIETVDLLLDEDGTVRDGVNISGHWKTNIKDDGGNITEVVDVTETQGWDTVLTNTDTEKGKTQQGKYHGWSNMVAGSGYIQLDLGAVSDISKIEFAPFINASRDDYWGRTYTVSLSNDADFTSKLDIATSYTFPTAKNSEGTYTLTAFEPVTGSAWQYRYIRFCCTDQSIIGSSKIKVSGIKRYVEQDLLHNEDGTLKATVTASHEGLDMADGKLKNVENVCDGKYEIEYDEEGNINFDKTTSFVTGWNGDKDEWVKIDLGEVKSLDKVRVLLYPGTSNKESAFYFKQYVSIQASNTADFSKFTTLATVAEEDKEAREKWLEFTSSDYTDNYRYIRVYQPSWQVIGVTEIQVTGYELCTASLCYTNIDDAIMDNADDTSKPKVSNVSNSNIKRGMSFTPDFCVVNDKIQLAFTGTVDADTVNGSTIKLTQTYNRNGNVTEDVSYTASVEDNIVYIDPVCLQSYAYVTAKITSGVMINGMKTTPKTLLFKTADIAPLAYRDGSIIRNVASGKNVIASNDDITDRLAQPVDQNWCYVTDNGIAQGVTRKNILIDLGNEYDVDAFGIDGPSWYWHIQNRDIYMSDKFEGIKSEANRVHKGGNESFNCMIHPRRTLGNTKKVRYVLLINKSGSGETLNEFSVYAYVPKNPAGNIKDAYFKRILEPVDTGHGIKNLHFYVEGDIADGTTLIIAGYDGNALSETKMTQTGKNISIPIEYAQNGNVKAFVWNGMSEIKPLLAPAEF